MVPILWIRKKSFRSVIPAMLLLGLTVGVMQAGCGAGREAEKKPAPAQAPAPTVVVEPVEQRTVPIYVEFVGQTQAPTVVELRARVEGALESIDFEEGKPVRKDQVLYQIDSREYKANLATAEADLAKARANLELALEQVSVRSAEAALLAAQAMDVKEKKEAERYEYLVGQNAASQQDLDVEIAQAQVSTADVQVREAALTNAKITERVGIESARAAVEAAEATVIKAKLNLEYCTIKSPIDGLIGRTVVDPGNLVGRGESTLLNTVSSVDPIWVNFALSESEYLFLMKRHSPDEEPKSAAEMELILADESVYPEKGTFRMADRAVDTETGTLSLVASFPNPTAVLRPGQFGRVRVVGDTIENALLIPARAVMEQQSVKVVYVVDSDNTVALRPVTLGPRYEKMYVVTEGLEAGDQVIVDGIQKARPGGKVNPSAPEDSRPTANDGGR